MKTNHVPGHKVNIHSHLTTNMIQIVFSNNNTWIYLKRLILGLSPSQLQFVDSPDSTAGLLAQRTTGRHSYLYS